jgi:hypothetical protein
VGPSNTLPPDRERFGFSSSEAGAQGQTGGRKGKGKVIDRTARYRKARPPHKMRPYRFRADRAIHRITHDRERRQVYGSAGGRRGVRLLVWTTRQHPPRLAPPFFHSIPEVSAWVKVTSRAVAARSTEVRSASPVRRTRPRRRPLPRRPSIRNSLRRPSVAHYRRFRLRKRRGSSGSSYARSPRESALRPSYR